MGTYDTRGGSPISPDVREPYICETRREAEDWIAKLFRKAKSGEMHEQQFEAIAYDVVTAIDVNGDLE